MNEDMKISKPVAPEDLQPEMYVAALTMMIELLPRGCDEPEWKKPEVVRTVWLPVEDVGVPLRVVEVCLPFVLVEQPSGKHQTLDTRRYRLARLSDQYAKKACKKLRATNGGFSAS
jgi:hypothetical protein